MMGTIQNKLREMGKEYDPDRAWAREPWHQSLKDGCLAAADYIDELEMSLEKIIRNSPGSDSACMARGSLKWLRENYDGTTRIT